MYSKQIPLLFLLYFSCFFLCACDKNLNPISSTNHTYETDYGIVTQIDNNPLFKIQYSSDYKFDEYLQSGHIPFNTSNKSISKNYYCTCFSAFGEDNRLFGRNYDWPEPSTYFLVFTDPPNGYSSVSTVDMYFFEYNHDQSPAFSENQNALRTLPFNPFDGINEKGVAIGMNAVPEAQSPYDATKVTIGELQLIRLVLDYASSTEEAITLIQQYNIRMEEPPIHYLIADTSGHSVIIEFVNGRIEIIDNAHSWQVTTNFVITGLENPQNAQCWRYKTAYETLRLNNGVLSDDEAIDLLRSVSVETTRWSTVFNIGTGQIQMAIGRNYDKLYFFSIPF